MTTLASWLDQQGLGKYAERLAAEEIDLDILPDLGEEDLERLGLPLGARRKLIKAAKSLQDGAAWSVSPSAGALARTPAERRQLTVLFCDLAGSTQLSQRLDPESLRSLIDAYHRACRAIIERFEGHVAQYLGDGVMAYFGWPRAHEDDAERALRAGLELVSAVKAVNAPSPLQVRIGVASGPVVVGEGEGSDDPADSKLAVGETPNLAARLQGLAELDEVIIAPSTKHLAGGMFRYADLGAQTLKGIVEPVRAWKVRSLSEAQGRFEARSAHLTPLVGRQDEVQLLDKRWAQASGGEGQVVLISGEPGIGKSRLTQALSEHVIQGAHIWLRYQCSPYHVNSAFYPIVEQLTRAAKLAPEDSAQNKLHKLDGSLAQARSHYPHATQLIAALLGIPTDHPSLNYTPQKQKDETIKALGAQVTGLARHAPVLMVLEDAHWIDPSSLEAFEHLVQTLPSHRILLLMTYRPEFQPKWIGQSHVTLLALNRLDRRQTSLLAAQIAEGHQLSQGLLEQIQARTDGIPLFIEELTKAVIEGAVATDAGAAPQSVERAPLAPIPATLRDSLMARLDRIGSAREVAQLAACIGREFDYGLLAAAAQMDAAKLDSALDQLVAAELVFERGVRPDATYQFKHALVQDAAYESLLKGVRARLHGAIAQALEVHFPQRLDTAPEILARHYSAADLSEPAAQFWNAAGKRAWLAGAYREAIAHLEHGLGELSRIEPSQERDILELSLRTDMGLVWQTYGGWSHPKVPEHLETAHKLAQRLQRLDEGTYRISAALHVYRFCRGEIKANLNHDLEELAERIGAGSLTLSALAVRIGTLFYAGEFRAAIAAAESVAEGYDLARDRGSAQLLGVDPMMQAAAFRAYSQWLIGYPQQARAAAQTVMKHAAALGLPFNLAWCHIHCSYVMQEIGDATACGDHLDRAEDLAREQGIAFISEVWVPFARMGQLRAQERHDEVVKGFAAAKETWIRSGLMIGLPWYSVHGAVSMIKTGRVQGALELLDDALEQIRRPGWEERVHLAEVHRVRALALSVAAREEEAEADFRASLEVAREQKAKSLELRAATDYARFLHKGGGTPEALALLEPIYDWFTEGFETKDLIEAKALLGELRIAAPHARR